MTVTPTDRARGVAGRLSPTPLGAVGLLAAAAALAATGPAGLAAGAAVLVVGLVVPAAAAFALGQAALLAAVPAPTPLELAAVEGALFVVLLGPAAGEEPAPVLAGAVLLFAGLGAATWFAVGRVGLLPAAAGLVVGVGLAAYLVHRYERVVLGLAGGEAA